MWGLSLICFVGVAVLIGAVAPLITDAFKFVPLHGELVYEYVGTVRVGAQPPMDTENSTPPPASGWKIRGTLKLQRHDNRTLAAAVSGTFLWIEKFEICKAYKTTFFLNTRRKFLTLYSFKTFRIRNEIIY